MVKLEEILKSEDFKKSNYILPIALGRKATGGNKIVDLAKFPHLLVAGATGSGKSVCLDSIILSLDKIKDVKLVLVDTKVVGFSIYKGLKSLLCDVCTENWQIERVLDLLVKEMNDRYRVMAEKRVRSFEDYNNQVQHKLERVVLVIDEYADLVMNNKKIQDRVMLLVQKSRACGIHVILSTQRPSADVINGIIKANIPARIALSVSTSIDSRVILDRSGAEKLNGNGDMLLLENGKLERLQGSYVSDEEIRRYVDNERREVCNSPEVKRFGREKIREDVRLAGISAIRRGFVSIGNIQREFKVDFKRASAIMSDLEEIGVVSKQKGTESRKIIMSLSDFMEVAQ